MTKELIAVSGNGKASDFACIVRPMATRSDEVKRCRGEQPLHSGNVFSAPQSLPYACSEECKKRGDLQKRCLTQTLDASIASTALHGCFPLDVKPTTEVPRFVRSLSACPTLWFDAVSVALSHVAASLAAVLWTKARHSRTPFVLLSSP